MFLRLFNALWFSLIQPLKRRAHTIRPMEDPWAMLTGDGSEPSASTAADGEGPSSMDVDESVRSNSDDPSPPVS